VNKVINLSLSDTSTDCSQYCKLLLHSTPTSIRLCRVANIDLLVYLLSGYSKCVGREHCSVHDGAISSLHSTKYSNYFSQCLVLPHS